MFFIFSKLLKFMITPLMWVIVLLFIAIISRDQFKRKKFLLWGFGVLIFFSNPLIFNKLMGFWEVPLTRYEDLKTYDAGIVMSGIISYNEEHNRIQFLRGADRLFQAIDLYKIGKIKKIVFTGGSGEILHPEYNEGLLVKQYVMRLGIPETDFLVEDRSRNTHENALFTKQLLEKENIKGRLLLITSAFHMRRSLACFNKENVFPEYFCVDRYVSDEKESRGMDVVNSFVPSLYPLLDWTNFIHELTGYVVYKIAGYA